MQVADSISYAISFLGYTRSLYVIVCELLVMYAPTRRVNKPELASDQVCSGFLGIRPNHHPV